MITKEGLSRAAAYLLELRVRRQTLMREGFPPHPLNDMEAGACGVLGAMGVDIVELTKDFPK